MDGPDRIMALPRGEHDVPRASEGRASVAPPRPDLTELRPELAISDRRALMAMTLPGLLGHEPLGRVIFERVAIDIIEGRRRPGDSINSVELAQSFGTSRTPVREALADLEAQGLIVVPPKRRPYIPWPTRDQVRNVYQLRAALFALVSELIVDVCPDEELTAMWVWQEALEDDVARGAVDDYFWHDVGFRLVEAQLARNEELQRLVSALGVKTLLYRHLSLSLSDRLSSSVQDYRLSSSVQDHRRLLIAYQDRDKLAAVAMTRALITAGYKAIERSGSFRSTAPSGKNGTTTSEEA